jgi:protoporphyrin/coproporphyrin ferrochelatase
MNYDAILIVSFGAPECREDVIPFLENVLKGRNAPRERLLTVAEHYYHFDGKSPMNQQIRDLMSTLKNELQQHGISLPIYWGNRNWHPVLAEALAKMKQDRIRAALAFVTSAYSSYSGCRQYREDIARAQNEVGPGAPQVHKLRPFFNHPGFIEATVERVQDAFRAVTADARKNLQIVYTAHSVPVSMSDASDYVRQLQEVRRLVSKTIGHKNDALVYQSRSGAPGQPWLGPDILDYLRDVRAKNLASAVMLVPIGFVSDHMEVVYDLDVEAGRLCAELGLPMTRAKTVGVHPKFVAMIRELIEERINPAAQRRSLGSLAARPDVCAEDCCPAPRSAARTG